MTGPVEETGKAVSGIIEALKQQPAVLALTVILLGLLVFCFYALSSAASFRSVMLTQQADYQKYVTEILSRCIVPRANTNFKLQSDEATIIPLPPLNPLRSQTP
jgi:ABC-type Na+ efflux pump permease subunit